MRYCTKITMVRYFSITFYYIYKYIFFLICFLFSGEQPFAPTFFIFVFFNGRVTNPPLRYLYSIYNFFILSFDSGRASTAPTHLFIFFNQFQLISRSIFLSILFFFSILLPSTFFLGFNFFTS